MSGAEKPTDAIPDYPFWQATDLDAAFGADCDRYAKLTKSEANAVSRQLRDEAKAFTLLFFEGGSLSDHGFKWKAEYAGQWPNLTLRALMASFEPSHEVKEATCALALYHWCDRVGDGAAA